MCYRRMISICTLSLACWSEAGFASAGRSASAFPAAVHRSAVSLICRSTSLWPLERVIWASQALPSRPNPMTTIGFLAIPESLVSASNCGRTVRISSPSTARGRPGW